MNNQDNFDNIFNSIINIFKIIVGENWVKTMWINIDSVGIDQMPVRNYNLSILSLYFLLVIVFNVLILNLFIGLVINNFKRIKDDLGGYLLLT